MDLVLLSLEKYLPSRAKLATVRQARDKKKSNAKYHFSVDYNSIDKSDILNIHKF